MAKREYIRLSSGEVVGIETDKEMFRRWLSLR